MKTKIKLLALMCALVALSLSSCNNEDVDSQSSSLETYDQNATAASADRQIYTHPVPHPTGVPPLSGMLDRSKIVMKSIISVDLDRHVARLPLFKGTFNGSRVWFVRLDVSNLRLAKHLGLNFAPRLGNAGNGCPTCIDEVTSSNPIPGNAEVQFSGTVDYSPNRNVTPGPLGFPPLSVTPGGVGTPLYSDLIRVRGTNVVYNAPIIATGNGPFDVNLHTNTHDRVVAIDTLNMTVDLHFVRAFAFGKDIFYFSIAATGEVAAAVERAQFVPAMANIPRMDRGDDPATARADIFAFQNGMLGLDDPNVQGLNHSILDNAPGELSNSNPALFNTLNHFGDARNVLGKFTTLLSFERFLYTPIWDLHIAKWQDSVVASGKNYAQTDASVIQQLASRGFITNPDGTPLSSTGFIVNCPIIGFATRAPLFDQAPD
jgi:hypothetical protein